MLLLAPVSLANAQAVPMDALTACAEQPSDAQRLECFMALAGTAESDAAPSSPAAEAAPVAESVVESTMEESPAVAAPVAAVATAEPKPAAEPVVAALPAATVEAEPSEPVSIAPTQEQAAAVASVETPEEAAPSIDDWGLRGRSGPDVVRARVVEVTRTRLGVLVFHFDNGQVWRQQEKRYFPYPRDRAFDVTLSTGMMGEYRLQVEGAGRRATIKRLQ